VWQSAKLCLQNKFTYTFHFKEENQMKLKRTNKLLALLLAVGEST